MTAADSQHRDDELPAALGGAALFPGDPPTWPLRDDDIKAALDAAWADGSWGRYHGPHTERLAAELSALHGVSQTLLCASGTIGVEIALRGLKVGPGDEVILAAYDFGGNFRAIEAVGAHPVLVDIEADTWCLDAAGVEAALSGSTRAVIVSHLHGTLADMAAIADLAQRRGVAIVEDACQVPGASVGGKPVGALADVSVHSFGGSKLLSAGRGGAVLTDRADVMQRMKVFCQRGNDAFPLSELQALVLTPQLAKLDERNQTRAQRVARLTAALEDLSALRPATAKPHRGIPTYYKLPWFYDAQSCHGLPREALLAAVRAEGVALDSGFRGFAKRPASVCRKPAPLPNSRRAAERTVLLHHPVLLESAAMIDRVALAIRRVVENADRLLPKRGVDL
ncbi:MAG: aminotransferase class V-fold PLP-dependent enzyme [Pirellulaceae bacterium]